MEAVEGFATSYGYTLLQPGTMANVPNIPLSKKGICIDLEHADKRDPDLLLEMMTDMSDICVALGTDVYWLGHYLSNPQGLRNGFTDANARTIQQLPGVRNANVIAIRRESPLAALAFLEAQLNRLRGPDGDQAIDYSKVLISMTLGVGSQQAVPLDQCAAIGQYCRERGIKEVHIRRAGQNEGGVATHFWQQQQMAYLPNLGGGIPLTGPAQVAAYEDVVVAAGGNITIDRLGYLTDLYSTLIDAGILEKIEMLTIFPAQDEFQAATDLRTFITGTRYGSTEFTVDRAWNTNGTTDYFDHGWAPSSSAVMTGSDQMIAIYGEDIASTASSYSAGSVVNSGTGQALRLNPYLTSGGVHRMQGQAGTNNDTFSGTYIGITVTGMMWTAYDSGLGQQVWGMDDTEWGATTPTVLSATLSTRNVYSGAFNNNGTASGFRAGKLLAVVVGARMSASDMGILKAALLEYLTDIGSRVGEFISNENGTDRIVTENDDSLIME